MAVSSDIVFRVVNLVAAAFMIIGGVAFILQGGFPNFITAVYCILFGVMVGLFEFKLPKIITQFASFMFSFLGRGLFYIFLGCIILNYNSLSLACGIIIILIGIVFCISHFISQIEPPVNMRTSTFEESFGMNHSGQQTQYNHPTNNTSYSPSSFNSNPIPSRQEASPYPMSPPLPARQEASPYPMSPPIPARQEVSPYSVHQETTPYPQKTYIPNESHIP